MFKKFFNFIDRQRADKAESLPISDKNLLRFFVGLSVVLALTAIYNYVKLEKYLELSELNKNIEMQNL